MIFLRNWELLSFDEIGRQLGISTDTACKRWLRAVAKLKKELANP